MKENIYNLYIGGELAFTGTYKQCCALAYEHGITNCWEATSKGWRLVLKREGLNHVFKLV